MRLFLQIAADALSLGGLYALYSLGVALIFGVSGVVNFAYGNFITLGAYTLLVVGSMAWPISVICVLLVVLAVGVISETAVFAPAHNALADSNAILIMTFALSVIIESVLLLAFGARPLGVEFGSDLSRTVDVFGADVALGDLLTIGVVVAALSGLVFFLKLTPLALQIRAASLDPLMLRMLGISARKVVLVTIALSSGIAGMASLMLVIQTGSLSLTMGLQPVLIAFIATVLGGLGSLTGAVAASFAIASVTVALQEFLPAGLQPFRTAILFSMIILVLLARPEGFFRSAEQGARV
jgi:branched-chain amino acid transport system permease protein